MSDFIKLVTYSLILHLVVPIYAIAIENILLSFEISRETPYYMGYLGVVYMIIYILYSK